ncbi:tyrosine-protein phosphatase 26-like isoform X1 [Styela clava]
MMPNTEKCEKYWPDQGMTNKYGEVGLENLEEITDGGFKVRKLIVISNAEVLNNASLAITLQYSVGSVLMYCILQFALFLNPM